MCMAPSAPLLAANPSARGVQGKRPGGERDILGQFSFADMQISGTSAGKSEHLVERAQSGEEKALRAKLGHPLQESGDDEKDAGGGRSGYRGTRPQLQCPGAAAWVGLRVALDDCHGATGLRALRPDDQGRRRARSRQRPDRTESSIAISSAFMPATGLPSGMGMV